MTLHIAVVVLDREAEPLWDLASKYVMSINKTAFRQATPANGVYVIGFILDGGFVGPAPRADLVCVSCV